MRNKYIFWLLSFGIIISIICIGVVARKSLSIYEQESISVTSQSYSLESYLIHLQDYLGYSVDIPIIKNNDKKNNILHELMVIANLEKKNDIQQMSIDGREIAISLIENIYEEYGVNITFGIDGLIQNIEDNEGNTIYKSVNKSFGIDIQIINLIIVLSIIILLFGLSIILTRKNKIFVKDGDFNGLDEKKYA